MENLCATKNFAIFKVLENLRLLLWFRVFSHSISCQPLLWNEAKWNRIQIYIFQSLFLYQQKTNFFSRCNQNVYIFTPTKTWLDSVENRMKNERIKPLAPKSRKKNNCSYFSIESWRQIYCSHWFSHRSLPIFFIFYFISFFCQNDFFLLLWIFFNEQVCFVVVFFESCWVCLVLLLLDLV